MRKLIISVDFDGVCCSKRYPEIGVPLNGVEILRSWYERHTIILNSCRTGKYLDDAIAWMDLHDLPFHYVNENCKDRIGLYAGTDPRKISCDVFIDDVNSGGFRGWKPIIEYVKKMESQLPIIVCIVGESGTGKSFLSRRIEETYGHTLIHSYTDRPSRGEGDDHVFLTKEQFDAIDPADMIAFTHYGDYRYCCTKQDVKDMNTYIISEDGMLHLLENFSYKYDIRTIRMRCSEDTRVMRAGAERVARDSGRFTLRNGAFDVVLRSDSEYSIFAIESILL